MSRRNTLLLVIALFVAGVTALAVRSRVQPVENGQPVQQAQSEKILVAAHDIPAGGFVKASEDLAFAAWPKESIQEYHIREGVESAEAYQGAVAHRALKAGEPVTANALIKPGAGGFLSAVLEPGKRAVSVEVSPTSGNAGFIFPGDKVDLILTHRIRTKESEQAQEQESVVSETFIENARVVAVDQMMDNPENKAILAKTVTVEVSPEQAEMVSVATDMGKISFALRSLATQMPAAEPAQGVAEGGPLIETDSDYVSVLAGEDGAPRKRFTRDSDISRMLNRQSNVAPRVTVFHGDTVEKREFIGETE